MLKSLFSAFICKRKPSPAPTKRAKIESECPICKSPIFRASITLCGHSFCESCIDSHLSYNQTCPLCRKDLSGTLLYPSKAFGSIPALLRRVKNGIKSIQTNSKVHIKDEENRWWIGTVKLLIPNGENYPFLLITYSNGEDHIELVPQDSERLRPIRNYFGKTKTF